MNGTLDDVKTLLSREGVFWKDNGPDYPEILPQIQGLSIAGKVPVESVDFDLSNGKIERMSVYTNAYRPGSEQARSDFVAIYEAIVSNGGNVSYEGIASLPNGYGKDGEEQIKFDLYTRPEKLFEQAQAYRPTNPQGYTNACYFFGEDIMYRLHLYYTVNKSDDTIHIWLDK